MTLCTPSLPEIYLVTRPLVKIRDYSLIARSLFSMQEAKYMLHTIAIGIRRASLRSCRSAFNSCLICKFQEEISFSMYAFQEQLI
jgi:hypothetical protein